MLKIEIFQNILGSCQKNGICVRGQIKMKKFGKCRLGTGCPEKTDTIVLFYNSENKHSTFKNSTCLYSQKHGKANRRYRMTCKTHGQSRQLLKADARYKPPSGG